MRLAFLAFFAVCLLLAPQGRATPQDDAAFVVREVMDGLWRDSSRAIMAANWVAVFAERLGERSVRVLDRDRFAQGLPQTVTDGWVERLGTVMADQCFRKISVQDLHEIAEAFRNDPDRSWANRKNDRPATMAEFRDDVDELGENTPVRVTWLLSFCTLPLSAQIKQEMRVALKILTDGHSGEIAEILAEPGIAAFPNRIVKQNILSEIRKAGR